MTFLSNIWCSLLSNHGLCTLIAYWSILVKKETKVCVFQVNWWSFSPIYDLIYSQIRGFDFDNVLEYSYKGKAIICCHFSYYEVKNVWYNLANVSPYFHCLETSIHFSIWYHNFKLKIIFQIYHMSKCPSFHDMLHDGVSTSLHRAHQAPN